MKWKLLLIVLFLFSTSVRAGAEDWALPLIGGFVLGGAINNISRPYPPAAYQYQYVPYGAYGGYYYPQRYCREVATYAYDMYGRELRYPRVVCD